MEELKQPLLRVEDLQVRFPTETGAIHAVNGICYQVFPGEIVGIVGESGSGKSVASHAILRLVQNPGQITGGSIRFDGTDVLSLNHKELTAFRGERISMIFQDPVKYMDSMFTVGFQLTEVLLAHRKLSRQEAKRVALETLRQVGFPEPERIMSAYPHALSGGMLQRIMIAMALITQPDLIIADEPTTALDVTLQHRVLQLLKKLCLDRNMGMVFITHNLEIAANLCHRIYVMYGGRIMESGTVDEIFQDPRHPYTQGLLQAIVRMEPEKQPRLQAIGGTPIDPANPPTGCPFHPRCPRATKECAAQMPNSLQLSATHSCACWNTQGGDEV